MQRKEVRAAAVRETVAAFSWSHSGPVKSSPIKDRRLVSHSPRFPQAGHLLRSLDSKATEPPLLPVAPGRSPCTAPPPPTPFGQQAGRFIVHFVDLSLFGLASRVVMRVARAALFRIRGTSFDVGHTEFNSRASSRPGILTRPPPLAIAFAFRFSEQRRSWPSREVGFASVKRANLLRRLSRLHCSSIRRLIGRFPARLGPLVTPAELDAQLRRGPLRSKPLGRLAIGDSERIAAELGLGFWREQSGDCCTLYAT